MRLDKYLKVSRIIKRRTVAKEMIDRGLVTLDGKIAKASSEVKPNSIIDISNIGKFKVVKLLEHATEEMARTMYVEVK